MQGVSSWIVVGVSVERVFAVWMPHKIHSISNKKTIFFYLLVILLVLLSVYFPFLFTTKLVEEKHCIIHNEYLSTMTHHIILVVFRSVVPFVIMLSSSVLIVIKIITSARERAVTSNSSEGRSHIQASVTIVAVSMIFFILMVPTTFFALFVNPDYVEGVFDALHYDGWISENVLQEISIILVEANFSANFLLYLLTGKFKDMSLEPIGRGFIH